MNIYDDVTAFRDNEIEANRYAANCMCIIAIVVAIVWILNLLGIFIVPQDVMAIAASGSIVMLLIPTLICRLSKTYSKYTKFYIMICCTVAITLIAAAMPKHGIVAWATPVALSCHYYSKKFTWQTYFTTALLMAIALPVSAFFGEWDVSIFGVGSIENVRIIDGGIYKRLYLFMFLPRILTLAGICSIFITLSQRTRALLEKQVSDSMEKQRIASELDVASHIQSSMLPCIFPAFPECKEFDIYATMTPAKEVGGDFYDFFMVDEDNLAIVAADVSGKGVPAALFMVIGKTLIKDHTTSDKDLGEVFTEVNQLLCESNSEELFITAFVGVLNLKTGEFRYVNAGHELPFISKKNASFEPYKIRAAFVLAGMEGLKYKAGVMQLEPGDKIFQYTDGVTEATDKDNRLFGMDRLQNSLAKVFDKSPKEVLAAVKADIDEFVGEAPQFDDITMICVEYKGSYKSN